MSSTDTIRASSATLLAAKPSKKPKNMGQIIRWLILFSYKESEVAELLSEAILVAPQDEQLYSAENSPSSKGVKPL